MAYSNLITIINQKLDAINWCNRPSQIHSHRDAINSCEVLACAFMLETDLQTKFHTQPTTSYISKTN